MCDETFQLKVGQKSNKFVRVYVLKLKDYVKQKSVGPKWLYKIK